MTRPHHNGLRILVTTLGLTAALSLPALAQDKGSREREALRRVQQALRTAQEEAAALERDKARLAADKESLSQQTSRLDGELRRTSARTAGLQARAEAAQAKAAQLESELAAARGELETLKGQLATTSQKLHEQQQAVASVTALMTQHVQARRALEARNAQLYRVGAAVIEMYRSRSPAETLARQEPFFGIGAVTLDNVAEIWLDRLEEARLKDADKLQF